MPGKTVYILGSGFSYPLGIPVIQDFLPKGLAILKREKSTSVHNGSLSSKNRWKMIKDVMQVTNGYRRKLASVLDHEPNIEDMFSLADLLGETRVIPVRDLLARFVRAVCYWAVEVHDEDGAAPNLVPRAHFISKLFEMPRVENPPRSKIDSGYLPGVCLYQAFLSQVLSFQPNHGGKVSKFGYDRAAIVSLNYDLVVERKLQRLKLKSTGKAPKHFLGYGVHQDDRCFDHKKHHLPLIKLHGSIDWKKSSSALIRLIVDPHTSSSRSAPMVFPTWQRSSFEGTVFAKLLDEVRIHLRLASKIVFIGYSLPTSDTYMRYLLADSLDTVELPEIEVANKFSTKEIAVSHVATVMGARAARMVTRNHDGLEGFVKSSIDKSSFDPGF